MKLEHLVFAVALSGAALAAPRLKPAEPKIDCQKGAEKPVLCEVKRPALPAVPANLFRDVKATPKRVHL